MTDHRIPFSIDAAAKDPESFPWESNQAAIQTKLFQRSPRQRQDGQSNLRLSAGTLAHNRRKGRTNDPQLDSFSDVAHGHVMGSEKVSMFDCVSCLEVVAGDSIRSTFGVRSAGRSLFRDLSGRESATLVRPAKKVRLRRKGPSSGRTRRGRIGFGRWINEDVWSI